MPEEQQQQQQPTGQPPSSPTSPTSPTQPTNGATGWLNVLPAPYRNDESFKNYKDIESFLKSHKSLESKLGTAIWLPKDDAPPEEWDKVYSKLGRPEAPDKYEIPKPAELPPGTAWNDGLEAQLRDIAYRNGWNQKGVQELAEAFVKDQMESRQNVEKQWDSELSKEWGYSKDENMALANRAYNFIKEGIDNPELAKQVSDFLDSTGLGNHPLMIKFFAAVGDKIKEDMFVEGDEQATQVDEAALKKEEAEILSKPEFYRAHLPGHDDLVKRYREIYAQLYPEKPKESL